MTILSTSFITYQSDQHGEAVASRNAVAGRVCEAIIDHGQTDSVARLVRNVNAELLKAMLEKLVERATKDVRIAADLRRRTDIDWRSPRGEIDDTTSKMLETLGAVDRRFDPIVAGKVNAVVYNRMRNRAGFSSTEWKVAYNQVKALSNRKQLNERVLARFARFGYGYHAAVALTVLLQVKPKVCVK
ncbi:MAG: DUF2336 domain-containing protein, partial [Candidatus Devosia symbiotica]|nr:DUF2336 domain-containing protein [Candidatus Devosia symbiotica]